MKVKNANGVTGCFITVWTGSEQKDYTLKFRVYEKDHTFTDYDIVHNDLSVTIDDEDAAFYILEDGRAVLDHSPETLGIKA